MLKIDYVVKTDEDVEVITHRQPDSLNEVDKNIILIEGPGSTGKSTLLNMIAIGCFGIEDNSLSESTLGNLEELSSEYRDVKFDIQINDPTSGAFLRLQKEKGKALKVSESMEGRPITAREFRNKYKLIYDVPEDPTKRLKDMTKMIKNNNKEISNKIKDLSEIVANHSEMIDDIPTVQEISTIQKDLDAAKKYLDDTQNEYDSLKIRDRKCKLVLHLTSLLECKSNIEQLKNKIRNEENKPSSTSERIGSIQKKWIQKYNSLSLGENIRQIIVNSRNEELICIVEKLNEMWDDLNPYDLESSIFFLNDYESLLREFKVKIPNNSAACINIRLANDLINLLNKSNPDESLGELGTVNHVRECLEKYKDGLNAINYNPVIAQLSKILKDISDAKEILNNANEEEISDLYKDDNKLQQWNDDLTKSQNNLLNIKEELHKLDYFDLNRSQSTIQKLIKDLSNEYSIDESTFKATYMKWSDELNKFESKRKDQADFIVKANNMIQRYENAKSLPFFDKRDEIQKIGNACLSIRSSLIEMDKRLDKIDKQDKTEYEKHPELYDPIWEYMGNKLGTVRNRGVTYEVKSVNLLMDKKGVITTSDGRKIHIDSMGTGEGQQTYLKGLLSTDDSRKIIALFDEVGNMSGNILHGVIEDLVEKQKEGKLMLGIMVQPRDDEKVTTYGI